MKDKYRKNKTDFGRTIVRKRGSEEPLSAKNNWDLWKLCQELNPEEISFLITKRKSQIKYSNDNEEIRILREDIIILEDAYRILKRKNKEVKK